MSNNQLNKSVVCFGEVLWDLLPQGKRAGGAPMNVAYHLHKLGLNSTMISSIGDDQSGKELQLFLIESGLPIEDIQVDSEHATSEVHANVNEHQEVEYDIIYPVAWDYIKWKPEYAVLLSNAEAFVYGSLGARNAVTRETLLKLLDHANYKVFDVNLREPHYSADLIVELLEHADLVKLNTSELSFLSKWYFDGNQTELETIEMIFDLFKIKEMIVTRGSKGASYFNPTLRYDYPAYSVIVNDTVGSGDSFLAAFLTMKLKGEPLEVALDYAVAMGAFITSQSGACPDYELPDFNKFLWKRSLIFQDERFRGNK